MLAKMKLTREREKYENVIEIIIRNFPQLFHRVTFSLCFVGIVTVPEIVNI